MNAQYWNTVRRMLRKAIASLSDEDALDATVLFPTWKADMWCKRGQRLRYEDKLYRVEQSHTSSAIYVPGSVGSEALYSEVAEPEQGDTPSNPIPYNNKMELYEGKYYSQNDVVYICFRSTGVPVFNNLADLVHIYVEVYVGE